jgi:hypothetical protein
MTTVRRSSRLAAKEVLKALPTRSARKEVCKETLKEVQTLSARKEFQPKEEPIMKTIDLEKVSVPKPVPKLVDYDSDDSQRTISDIVTLPAKPFLVKTETVKPQQRIKTIDDSSLGAKAEPVIFKKEAVKAPSKQIIMITSIRSYLEQLENTRDRLDRVKVVIGLFELIDKEFDYISSSEFDAKRTLIPVIHLKADGLSHELKYLYNIIVLTNKSNDINMLNFGIYLLNKVHTKCHLYGIHQVLTDDPVYKNFLHTFINQYV